MTHPVPVYVEIPRDLAARAIGDPDSGDELVALGVCVRDALRRQFIVVVP